MQDLALAIDIGGTNTKLGIVTAQGEVLEHHKFETRADLSFSLYLESLEKETLHYRQKYKDRLKGIGVGAPCGSYVTQQIVDPPNLKAWGTQNAGALIQEKLKLKTLLDNDANVAALGEKYFGAAKNSENFVVVTLGTGVGTGIFVHGDILRGSTGLAGEGGHIVVSPKGRECACGSIGHLEAYVCAKGIKRTYSELFNEETTFTELSNRYNQGGDEKAIACITKTADYLGRGLATMGSILYPDMFILAGGVSSLGPSFTKMVEERLNYYIFNLFKNKIKVELSQVAISDGAILGAASLVFHKN
jgi:glucokinase